jgi:hypothetical protein
MKLFRMLILLITVFAAVFFGVVYAADEQAAAAPQSFTDWAMQNWLFIGMALFAAASEIIGASTLKSNGVIQLVLAALGAIFGRSAKVFLLLIMILSLVACGGTTVLKTAQVTKEAAEAALYEARILQNTGAITVDQFNEVRTAYDALKAAQDTLIDARESYIQSPSQDNKTALTSAASALARESTALIDVARKYKIGEGVIWK